MAKSRKKRRRRGPGRGSQPARPRRRSVSPAPPAPAAGDERPPAPWGSFPLQELVVLAALIILVIGLISANPVAIAVGVALGCLGGLELSIREHLAGYRSHTTLLAGAGFVASVAALYYAAHLVLIACLAVGAIVFLGAFIALRRAFQRASGGLSYRVGGLRG